VSEREKEKKTRCCVKEYEKLLLIAVGIVSLRQRARAELVGGHPEKEVRDLPRGTG